MRGKTNIPNRKDPVINGNIENFVVAENNTIGKGDFVSVIYNTVFNKIYDDFRYFIPNRMIKFNGNYFLNVRCSNSSLTSRISVVLSKDVNGKFIILDEVEHTGACVKYKDDKIYIMESYPKIKMYVYELQNDKFNLLQSYELTMPNYSLTTGSGFVDFDFIGNKVVFIAEASSNTYLCYANFDEDENDFTLQLNNPSRDAVTLGGSGYQLFVFNNDEICVAYNYAANEPVIRTYSLDVESYTKFSYIAQKTLNNASISNFNTYFISNVIVVVSGVFYFIKYDNQNFTTFTKSLTFTTTWGGFLDNNTFVVSNFGYSNSVFSVSIEVFVFNNGTISNYVERNVPITEISNASQLSGGNIVGAISNSGMMYLWLNFSDTNINAGYISAKFKNEELIVGEVTNFVEGYNGSSIGFAKTGGNAGDIIQVYVPPVTT